MSVLAPSHEVELVAGHGAGEHVGWDGEPRDAAPLSALDVQHLHTGQGVPRPCHAPHHQHPLLAGGWVECGCGGGQSCRGHGGEQLPPVHTHSIPFVKQTQHFCRSCLPLLPAHGCDESQCHRHPKEEVWALWLVAGPLSGGAVVAVDMLGVGAAQVHLCMAVVVGCATPYHVGPHVHFRLPL